MRKTIILIFGFIFLTSVSTLAQNSNSSTTTARPRTSANTNSNTNRTKPPAPQPQTATGAEGVLAAFDALIDGIRHANVNTVTNVYWNSPQLNLFNYNGTVTKGWAQVRKNRESSYPEIKDVKLEIRDRNITMLGRDAALVTCLWTQSQTYKGTPETASGRMTLVFKRVGTAWKAIHLHSSPDMPNPASIPPSEQRPSPQASPTPPPRVQR